MPSICIQCRFYASSRFEASWQSFAITRSRFRRNRFRNRTPFSLSTWSSRPLFAWKPNGKAAIPLFKASHRYRLYLPMSNDNACSAHPSASYIFLTLPSISPFVWKLFDFIRAKESAYFIFSIRRRDSNTSRGNPIVFTFFHCAPILHVSGTKATPASLPGSCPCRGSPLARYA